MDVTIIERLKEYIGHEKISPPDLYKKIGVHRSIWSGWINQGKAIPVDKIVALLNALPELNSRWLLTGDGKMNNTSDSENEKKSDPHYDCIECDLKDNEISALKIAISAKEELLEIYKGEKVINAKTKNMH